MTHTERCALSISDKTKCKCECGGKLHGHSREEK